MGGDPLSHTDPLGLFPPPEEGGDEETREEAWARNPGLGPNLVPRSESQMERENGEEACRRNRLPSDDSQLGHIFDAQNPGHLPNLPENQQLLEDLTNNPDAELGKDSRGLTWYAQTLPDGTQVWASTMNGVIQNGGLNQVPRNYSPQTGLSFPSKP